MVRPGIPKVSPFEYPSLNKRFYRLAPYDYLDARLQSLVLTVSDDTQEDLAALLGRGVSYKTLKMNGEPSDRTALDRYAAIESTVLLHHASEALLRLYLAHARRAPCPWLELSSLLTPTEFKKALKKLNSELDNLEQVDDLVEVFSFSTDHSFFEGVDEESWASHRAALVRLVQHLIRTFLDGANAYNAAKHGLALGAGDLGLRLGQEGEEPLFDHSGPALNYLELKGAPDDRHWMLTSTFIDPPRNIALVVLVLNQIKNLWTVAKTRHKIERPESARFSPLSLAMVEEVLDGGRKEGFSPMGFSEQLHAAD
jgi:hypothetical protein